MSAAEARCSAGSETYFTFGFVIDACRSNDDHHLKGGGHRGALGTSSASQLLVSGVDRRTPTR